MRSLVISYWLVYKIHLGALQLATPLGCPRLNQTLVLWKERTSFRKPESPINKLGDFKDEHWATWNSWPILFQRTVTDKLKPPTRIIRCCRSRLSKGQLCRPFSRSLLSNLVRWSFNRNIEISLWCFLPQTSRHWFYKAYSFLCSSCYSLYNYVPGMLSETCSQIKPDRQKQTSKQIIRRCLIIHLVLCQVRLQAHTRSRWHGIIALVLARHLSRVILVAPSVVIDMFICLLLL